MTTSSLAKAVAAVSPVPLPYLPNLLLDPENLAKLELAFPGHEFASLLHLAKKFIDFKAPVWLLPLPSIQNEIVTRFRKATKAGLPEQPSQP